MAEANERMDIGSKVKKVRNLLGMTRLEFSKALDIPNGTIKGIESGNHMPGYNIIHKIANHPDMSRYATWLITDTDDSADAIAENLNVPDKELLVTIVEVVEEILQKKRVELSPTKKGELIYILYYQAIQSNAPKKIDRSNVLTLINYAR